MRGKTNYAGKFVIAFDTMCDGWQCSRYGNNKPVLYKSYDAAFKELFNDALAMLEGRTRAELREQGITQDLFKAMQEISKEGDVKRMKLFLDSYPDCNDNDEWIEPADTFLSGRRAFFTGAGVEITGTKLN